MQNQTCLSSAEVQPNEGVANAPFEIPESWIWVRLSDVCQIVGRIGFRGYTKSDLVESNGAITLSPSNIVEGKMDYSKCTYISWKKYEESPEIQIQNGDILLVKTGSSYGKCALVENLPQKATINPQFVTLKYIAIQATILTYILQSDYARTNYDNFVLGTAIPTFTQVALGDMLIPLVPQNEQTRILQEIARLFALIDEIDANKQNLQEYIKQAKLKVLSLAVHGQLMSQDPNDEPAIELLKRINPTIKPCDTSHYGNLPKGWCATTFEYLSTNIASKKYQIKQSEINESGKYPVISQSANFIEGYSDANSKLLHIPSPIIVFGDHTRITKYIDFDFIVGADGVKILLPLISAKYYYYLTQYVAKKIENRGYSRHYSYLSRYIVPLPPRVEQERIALRIEELFDVLDKISADL